MLAGCPDSNEAARADGIVMPLKHDLKLAERGYGGCSIEKIIADVLETIRSCSDHFRNIVELFCDR